jgi:hypothetical protein
MKILSLYTQLINKLQEYYVGHPNHDLTEELLKDARKELSDFNSEDNVVVISLKNYNELLDDQRVLDALHRGGVDNWEWYDESLSDLN